MRPGKPGFGQKEGALAVVLRDGKMLLLRRGDTAPYRPGHWANPGGRVEKGESPETALLRELAEETGLRARGFTFLRDEITGSNWLTHVYLVDPEPGDVVLSWEHDDFGWFSQANLPSPVTPVTNLLLQQFT